MLFKPHNGGLLLAGDTPFGAFRVEWDSAGKLVSESVTILDPNRGPCSHRGEQIGEQKCEDCKGSVSLKIFACSIHASCTIAKPLADVACCATCADWSAGRATQTTPTVSDSP